MPRTCSACSHEDSGSLTKAIINGGTNRDLAARFKISRTAIQRHRVNCLKAPRRQKAATDSAPWVGERLWDLVNRRYEAGRAVVVTSNVPPEQLAEYWTARDLDPHLGQSIARRLAEMAGTVMRIGTER